MASQLNEVQHGGEESNGLIEEQQRKLNGLSLDDEATETLDNSNEAAGKGNEEKKIFCGGISYETSNEDLALYFGKYGKVKEAQVKYDRMTGRSRGFAFVEFDTIEACKSSLMQREQIIKGKQCEIKPAKSREVGYMNKKVFVGGLPGDFPEDELRKHFTQYGKVEEIEWPFDKMSKNRKNFAFVVFEDEESADRAASMPKQCFSSRECDVKKAVPQSKRTAAFARGGSVLMRNSFSGNSINVAGGLRTAGAGVAQMPPHYTNATAAAAYAQWYYNAAAAYGNTGWYTAGNAAAAAAANPSASAGWYGHHNASDAAPVGNNNGF